MYNDYRLRADSELGCDLWPWRWTKVLQQVFCADVTLDSHYHYPNGQDIFLQPLILKDEIKSFYSAGGFPQADIFLKHFEAYPWGPLHKHLESNSFDEFWSIFFLKVQYKAH